MAPKCSKYFRAIFYFLADCHLFCSVHFISVNGVWGYVQKNRTKIILARRLCKGIIFLMISSSTCRLLQGNL